MAETKEAPKEDGKGWHIPEWVRDLGMKLLPWLIISMIGANVGLYIDNINNKKDIASNRWRLDQQDTRQTRFEARQDRQEEGLADVRENQHEFQDEALHRLDILIEKQARRRR